MKKRASHLPEMEFFSFPPHAAREGALEFYLNGVKSGSLAAKIIEAVYDEDSARLEKLLANKASLPDTGNIFGLTPLMMAAARNYERGVALILAHPLCNPDKQTIEGWTALHFAAEFGADSASKLLLSRFAARDIKNFTGETAEDIAKLREGRKSPPAQTTPLPPVALPHPIAPVTPLIPVEQKLAVDLIDAARNGSQDKLIVVLNKAARHFVFDPAILRNFMDEALRCAVTHNDDSSVASYLVRQGINPHALWDDKDSKKQILDDPFVIKKYKIRNTVLHAAFTKAQGSAFRDMILWSDKPLDDESEMYYRRKAASLLHEHLAKATGKQSEEEKKTESALRDIAFGIKIAQEKKEIRGASEDHLITKFNRAVRLQNQAEMAAAFAESTQDRFWRGTVTLDKGMLTVAADIFAKAGRHSIALEMEKAAKGKRDAPTRSPFFPWHPFG